MIQINERYIIDVETYNYVARRKHGTKVVTNKNTGDQREEIVYSTVGYYSSIPGAIKGIIEDMNKLHLRGTHDLKEAVRIITENNKQFYQLLEKALEI